MNPNPKHKQLLEFLQRVMSKRRVLPFALAEQDQIKIARWLTLSLLILAAVIVIMGFIVPLITDPLLLQFDFVLTNSVSLVVIAGALLLIRYGYVRFSATLIVIFLFTAVTYANISIFGNVYSANLVAYFVLIPLAGLVLDKRAMLFLSILSVIVIGLIFALELTGISAPATEVRATWDGLLVWLLAVTFNTVLLRATIQRSEESAETLYQTLTALQNSEAQLHEALKKEKELSELKSRFVSRTSHEFRTPLTVILSMAEFLLTYRNKLTEEQIDERLNKVLEHVDYMTDIMEDMLQLARHQEHRVEFDPVWLDLDGLCRNILEEFQSQPQAGSRLQYSSDDMFPQMYVDQQLIRQIFSNLISNALKYSPVDKIVMIQLRKTNQGVELEVHDEGIGIPTSDLSHLFEPFHRGENVETVSGTGLGLAIVKEAVERHNGTILIESQVGKGTTVTVKLPVSADLEKRHEKSFDH